MMDHRLQILLDQNRYEKVSREAARRGVSAAAVIRDAIDQLPIESARRRDAIAAILAADPMEALVDPAGLRCELDAAHDRSPV